MAVYRLEKGNWPIPDGTREVEWAVFKEGESKPFAVTFDENIGELIVECFNNEASMMHQHAPSRQTDRENMREQLMRMKDKVGGM